MNEIFIIRLQQLVDNNITNKEQLSTILAVPIDDVEDYLDNFKPIKPQQIKTIAKTLQIPINYLFGLDRTTQKLIPLTTQILVKKLENKNDDMATFEFKEALKHSYTLEGWEKLHNLLIKYTILFANYIPSTKNEDIYEKNKTLLTDYINNPPQKKIL